MRSFAAVWLCACSFEHGFAQHDSGTIDTVDVLVDVPLGANCYGPPGAFRICLVDAPTGMFDINAPTTYSTTTCTDGELVPQAGGPELCVRSAEAIRITATLTVSGSRPLVLLATGSISVSAAITVTAGANPTLCGMPGVGTGNSAGAGGGAGGSFGTQGGNGGTGFSGAAAGGKPLAATTAPITVLRGGCTGGAGGDSVSGGGMNGGAGGGAVYLLSVGAMTIYANINASGKGGAGGTVMKGGGGGGGSGGMIALFADNIEVTANVAANGGAGGEGADNNDTGRTGNDGNIGSPLSPATCPDGASSGGLGGNGAAGVVNALSGSPSGVGGGGGGGGHGVIRVLGGAIAGGTFSPQPS
jgi:hypothetical protein